jgi:hypothetical protein
MKIFLSFLFLIFVSVASAQTNYAVMTGTNSQAIGGVKIITGTLQGGSGGRINADTATTSGSAAQSGTAYNLSLPFTGIPYSTGSGTRVAVSGSDYVAATPTGMVYLCPSFMWTGTGLGAGGTAYVDEQLHINVSMDGYSWADINGGTPVYKAPSGGVRDPSLVRDASGTFWCAYTSGVFGRWNLFGLAKSQDLFHWTYVGDFPMLSSGTDTSITTWHGALVIDGTGTMHQFSATGTTSVFGSGNAAYEVTSSPPYNSWSAPIPVSIATTGSTYSTYNISSICPINSGTYLGNAQTKGDNPQLLSTSTDLQHWTPIDPEVNIFPQAPGGPVEDGEVFLLPGGIVRQYTATNGEGSMQIGGADYNSAIAVFGGVGLVARDLGVFSSGTIYLSAAQQYQPFVRVPQTSPMLNPTGMIYTSGYGLNLIHPGEQASPLTSYRNSGAPVDPTAPNDLIGNSYSYQCPKMGYLSYRSNGDGGASTDGGYGTPELFSGTSGTSYGMVTLDYGLNNGAGQGTWWGDHIIVSVSLDVFWGVSGSNIIRIVVGGTADTPGPIAAGHKGIEVDVTASSGQQLFTLITNGTNSSVPVPIPNTYWANGGTAIIDSNKGTVNLYYKYNYDVAAALIATSYTGPTAGAHSGDERALTVQASGTASPCSNVGLEVVGAKVEIRSW